MWVGDVALLADDGKVARKRTAATVFDGVAQLAGAGGFAHDAVINQLAALF